MAGLFKNGELTKNTKMLYVHGADDDLTLAKPCEEYVKNILAKEGQMEIILNQAGVMIGIHHTNLIKLRQWLCLHVL